ncbi:hypothetical protein E1B28_008267 [Marasmius oreades]|uniref:Uncharacterized protein n=1 Tax=Marasmius oreades TaxID=181124 RepID=A0A9P7RZ80_9AGAR|nr:uncharacterized protein E1B28_008267 [Marasmius oreades]KAG7091866.1 hypothetical protein E1B28_008267 [Marasmius oreades]
MNDSRASTVPQRSSRPQSQPSPTRSTAGRRGTDERPDSIELPHTNKRKPLSDAKSTTDSSVEACSSTRDPSKPQTSPTRRPHLPPQDAQVESSQDEAWRVQEARIALLNGGHHCCYTIPLEQMMNALFPRKDERKTEELCELLKDKGKYLKRGRSVPEEQVFKSFGELNEEITECFEELRKSNPYLPQCSAELYVCDDPSRNTDRQKHSRPDAGITETVEVGDFHIVFHLPSAGLSHSLISENR